MKILIAPDSFKGSMSAVRVCEIMRQAILDVCPETEVDVLPIADGGEGTVEAMKLALESDAKPDQVKEYHIEVNGSLANVKEKVSYLGYEDTAIIEMAQANGLEKLHGERDPLNAGTHGTGEMIKDAIRRGYHDILIGIGGSATNDGGTGAMQALGAVFCDKDGKPIGRMCGKELISIESINLDEFLPIIIGSHFTVMCDVDNPLTGPNGATYVYGPQKGACEEELKQLETGMQLYRKKLIQTFGLAPDMPGSGAAGGLGAALMLFLNANPVHGIEAVLNYGHFNERAAGSDLIITGEGKTDTQTLRGKAVAGICRRAKQLGTPVMLIAGLVELDRNEIISMGISEAISLMQEGMDLTYALEHAEEILYDRTRQTVINWMKTAREASSMLEEK